MISWIVSSLGYTRKVSYRLKSDFRAEILVPASINRLLNSAGVDRWTFNVFEETRIVRGASDCNESRNNLLETTFSIKPSRDR